MFNPNEFNVNSDTEICVYSKDSLLITDEEIFEIQLYNPECLEFNKSTAYLDKEYYYIFRGERKGHPMNLKVGIYYDTDTESYFKVEPETLEEKEKFKIAGKIAITNTNSIIDVINCNEDILVDMPDSTKIFMPDLSNNDDILKRLVKQALIQKNIDLDKYKDQFTDKNSLFNFKQVIKGDNKLSILIFDRGVDALGLRYRISLEEKDPKNAIGIPLDAPIIAGSEDTYEI